MSAVLVGLLIGLVLIGLFEGGKAVGRSQGRRERMEGQCDDHNKNFSCYLCNASRARKFPVKA